MKFLFILVQHLVPQHLLSRLAGVLAEATTPWLKNLLITRFIRRYGVDMGEAEFPGAADYPSFNAFFTRALKAGARPLPAEPTTIVSPADGVVSAAGDITGDTLLQAKGKTFSLTALLGGDATMAEQFKDGAYVTVYLSPKDYHRVHMPLAGTLQSMTYVPGKLFSVNQATSESIDDLFARNERAVCLFDTGAGPMAVILVGAMIVAAIDTVWAGQVAPSPAGITTTDYARQQPAVQIARGEEMGRFRLGSTVIVLFGPGAVRWRERLAGDASVAMGQAIGTVAD